MKEPSPPNAKNISVDESESSSADGEGETKSSEESPRSSVSGSSSVKSSSSSSSSSNDTSDASNAKDDLQTGDQDSLKASSDDRSDEDEDGKSNAGTNSDINENNSSSGSSSSISGSSGRGTNDASSTGVSDAEESWGSDSPRKDNSRRGVHANMSHQATDGTRGKMDQKLQQLRTSQIDRLTADLRTVPRVRSLAAARIGRGVGGGGGPAPTVSECQTAIMSYVADKFNAFADPQLGSVPLKQMPRLLDALLGLPSRTQKRCISRKLAKELTRRMNTDDNGEVDYDELISFISLEESTLRHKLTHTLRRFLGRLVRANGGSEGAVFDLFQTPIASGKSTATRKGVVTTTTTTSPGSNNNNNAGRSLAMATGEVRGITFDSFVEMATQAGCEPESLTAGELRGMFQMALADPVLDYWPFESFVEFCRGNQARRRSVRRRSTLAGVPGGTGWQVDARDQSEYAIAQLRLSASKKEEAALRQLGFTRVSSDVNAHGAGSRVYIWVKRCSADMYATRDEYERACICDIEISSSRNDATLLSQNFQRIDHSTNQGAWFVKHQYLYVRYCDPADQALPITRIAVTTGKTQDRSSAVWCPPSAGFKRVKGDLNKGNRSSAHSVFLWYWKADFEDENQRGRTTRRLSRVLLNSGSGRRKHSLSGKRGAQEEEEEVTALVREALRRRAHRRTSTADGYHGAEPVSGGMDLLKVWNKYDPSKQGWISRRDLKRALVDLGVSLTSTQLTKVARLMDRDSNNSIEREEFFAFCAFNPAVVSELGKRVRGAAIEYGSLPQSASETQVLRVLRQVVRKCTSQQSSYVGATPSTSAVMRRHQQRLGGSGQGKEGKAYMAVLDIRGVRSMLRILGLKVSRYQVSELIACFESVEDAELLDVDAFLSFVVAPVREMDDLEFARVEQATRRLRSWMRKTAAVGNGDEDDDDDDLNQIDGYHAGYHGGGRRTHHHHDGRRRSSNSQPGSRFDWQLAFDRLRDEGTREVSHHQAGDLAQIVYIADVATVLRSQIGLDLSDKEVQRVMRRMGSTDGETLSLVQLEAFASSASYIDAILNVVVESVLGGESLESIHALDAAAGGGGGHKHRHHRHHLQQHGVPKSSSRSGAHLVARCKVLFEEFDRNGNGHITKREFAAGLSRMQMDGQEIRLTSNELDMLVQRFDENGDGTVDVGEFVAFVRGVARVKKMLQQVDGNPTQHFAGMTDSLDRRRTGENQPRGPQMDLIDPKVLLALSLFRAKVQEEVELAMKNEHQRRRKSISRHTGNVAGSDAWGNALRVVFQVFDTEGKGNMSLRGFENGLRYMGVLSELERLRSKDLAAHASSSKRGRSLSPTRAASYLNDSQLRAAFDRIDVDGNGFVSLQSFARFMLPNGGAGVSQTKTPRTAKAEARAMSRVHKRTMRHQAKVRQALLAAMITGKAARKLQAGPRDLVAKFNVLDPAGAGMVSVDAFMRVVNENGLHSALSSKDWHAICTHWCGVDEGTDDQGTTKYVKSHLFCDWLIGRRKLLDSPPVATTTDGMLGESSSSAESSSSGSDESDGSSDELLTLGRSGRSSRGSRRRKNRHRRRSRVRYSKSSKTRRGSRQSHKGGADMMDDTDDGVDHSSDLASSESSDVGNQSGTDDGLVDDSHDDDDAIPEDSPTPELDKLSKLIRKGAKRGNTPLHKLMDAQGKNCTVSFRKLCRTLRKADMMQDMKAKALLSAVSQALGRDLSGANATTLIPVKALLRGLLKGAHTRQHSKLQSLKATETRRKRVGEQLAKSLSATAKRGVSWENVFAMYDVDGSGALTKRDLRNALAGLGLSLGDADFRAVVATAPVDEDGLIKYDALLSSLVGGSRLGELSQPLQSEEQVEEMVCDKVRAHVAGLGVGGGVGGIGGGAKGVDSENHEFEYASGTASAPNREQLAREVFAAFDRNGDGVISRRELRVGLERVGALQSLSSAQIRKLFNTLDPTRKGTVEVNKLVQWIGANERSTNELIQLLREHVRQQTRLGRAGLDAFRPSESGTGSSFNNNRLNGSIGSGYLNKEDFVRAVRAIGLPISDTECKMLFGALSVDKKGVSVSVASLRALLSPSSIELLALEAKMKQHVRELAHGRGSAVDVKRAFGLFDVNGSGIVTRKGFQQACVRLGLQLAEDELDLLLDRFDVNRDNTVDYFEFCRFISYGGEEVAALSQRTGRRLAQLMTDEGVHANDVFGAYDVTRSGMISRREFARGVKDLGLHLSDVEVSAFADLYSEFTGSDQVRYVDFTRAMAQAARHGDVDEESALRGGAGEGSGLSTSHAPADGVWNQGAVAGWLDDSATPDQKRKYDRVMQSMRTFENDKRGTQSRLVGDVGSTAAEFGWDDGEAHNGSIVAVPGDQHRRQQQQQLQRNAACPMPALWNCPVCFFKQTKRNASRCEMCDSIRPDASSTATGVSRQGAPDSTSWPHIGPLLRSANASLANRSTSGRPLSAIGGAAGGAWGGSSPARWGGKQLIVSESTPALRGGYDPWKNAGNGRHQTGGGAWSSADEEENDSDDYNRGAVNENEADALSEVDDVRHEPDMRGIDRGRLRVGEHYQRNRFLITSPTNSQRSLSTSKSPRRSQYNGGRLMSPNLSSPGSRAVSPAASPPHRRMYSHGLGGSPRGAGSRSRTVVSPRSMSSQRGSWNAASKWGQQSGATYNQHGGSSPSRYSQGSPRGARLRSPLESISSPWQSPRSYGSSGNKGAAGQQQKWKASPSPSVSMLSPRSAASSSAFSKSSPRAYARASAGDGRGQQQQFRRNTGRQEMGRKTYQPPSSRSASLGRRRPTSPNTRY